MVVFAIILVAVGPQVMLVAQLTVADPRFEALLFHCAGLAEAAVDALARAVDWDAFRVAGGGMGDGWSRDLGAGDFFGGSVGDGP